MDLVHRDPDILRGVLPAEEAALDLRVGNINFRSQVGLSRFDVLVDGQHELTFEVEVFPAKLDYREDCEQLLAEVQSILTALAFEYLKSTHVSGEGRDGPSTTLEWAAILRSVVDDLELGFRQVASHPIRGLRRDAQLRHVHRIRRVDALIRRAVRNGGGSGEWTTLVTGERARSQLTTNLAEMTLDTPEHRWLADHLRRCRSRVAELIAEERARPIKSKRRATALNELEETEQRLDRLLRVEPFRTCAAPPPPGFSSLQLLRAAGYREAYRALIALQLGLQLEGNALELSLKDISTLYEYWCYLAIIDLVAQKAGQEIALSRLVDVTASGLQVLLKKGRSTSIPFDISPRRRITVEYNPVFQGNVLLSQQPDIVLAVEDAGWPTARVVFDAKYRVDTSAEYVRQLGVPGPPADALNVLHRYRDAILTDERTPDDGRRLSRSVVYSVALYPTFLTPNAFLASPLYSQLRAVGVGAIPFLPSNREFLARWLDDILGLNAWALAQTAVPAAPDPWVWGAAAEAVLIGVLRSANAEDALDHLRWIQREHCYYMPESGARHGRQFAARSLALYVPAMARPDTTGAVAWHAEVVDIAVVTRGSVSTPWSTRDPAEPVRLYRLGELRPLHPAIRNDEGQRFSVPRWSTRLAVARAEQIDELFLESPLEWSLFDALRADRRPFRVRANPVPASRQEPARGRARFVLEDGRTVTYAGANGFAVVSAHGTRFFSTVHRTIAALREKA